MPNANPVVTPVAIFIEATDGLLLSHPPPGDVLENVVALPRQMLRLPVMAVGIGFTVIVSVLKQPVGKV